MPRKAVGPRRSKTVTKGVTFTPQSAAWDFYLPGTRINYNAEVGKDGLRSSVITSALCWIMRTFPEAPVVVERREEEQWRVVLDHGLTKLLRQPNQFYSGRVLWMATIMDFCFGEAFWLKVRNGNGVVVELWWIPRALIRPIWYPESPDVFIDHYEYSVNGRTTKLRPDDVVHFRFGMDPADIRRGFSQLAAVMREVYIDDQASNFTASILRNLGIIGVVFSPKEGNMTKDQADALKGYVQQNFTGDKRAQAMVFSGAMNTQLLQYNLQGFDVGPLRDISEERVCAALGIPAAVIGFGTGLQQTKVGATMREMVKLAWEGGIEPNQRIIASELDRSLLPEFQGNENLWRTRFDTSDVDAINESKAEKTDRVLKILDKNVIKVTQAQRELGYPVDASQDKYVRELMAPVAPAQPAPPPDNANAS